MMMVEKWMSERSTGGSCSTPIPYNTRWILSWPTRCVHIWQMFFSSAQTVMNIGDKDGSRSHRSRKKRKKPCKITGIESMNANNFKVGQSSIDWGPCSPSLSLIIRYWLRRTIREFDCTIFDRKRSNGNIEVIPINRAKFEQRSVTMINTSSGKWPMLDDLLNIVRFSGSEDSWFYIWKTEPNVPMNGIVSSSASPASAKLTRKQRRNFDRAFERIRGKDHFELEKIPPLLLSFLVHNTMVTSAIFAPNSAAIMDYLYLCSDSTPLTNRANNTQSRSSLPTTVAVAAAAAGTTARPM